MVALNVAAFQPLTEFHQRIDQYVRSLKDVPLAAGHSQVYYPGELEKQADAENRAKGLLLASETITDLVRVAREAGVDCSL
jgi:LDH2 family malate/lactate/ureidoglycolate dehydrogenase